jgi:hypothetical protein
LKQVYLSFSLLMFSAALLAQVEITGETYTNAGTLLEMENASPLWSMDTDLPNISGADQTWDASDWEGLNQTSEGYVAVSDAPFAYQFFFNNQFLYPVSYSTHTLSVNVEDIELPLPFEIGDPYSFFRNDEEGYFATGTGFSIEGLPIVTPNEIPDQILTFPLVYGNIDTTFSEYLTAVPFLGAYGQSGSRVSTVDGWGTMITPDGSFDVLRVSAVRALVDTIYIEQVGSGQTIERPIQIDYMWISPEVPGPLLEMSTVDGAVISARMNRGFGVVGLNELDNMELAIFPNPTSSVLNVNAEGVEAIRIVDIHGKRVFSQQFGLGQGQVQIQLDDFATGTYVLEVETSEGLGVRKFVKE